MLLKDQIESHPVYWALGTLLAGFLAGIGAYKGIVEASGAVVISRANSEGFEKQRESLKDLRRQHEFVVRYLRYEMAKPVELQFNEPRATPDEFELSKRMFVSLILKWWMKQEELDGELVLNPQVIRKGLDPTNSRVQFADGTTWPIPGEIKAEVLKGAP